MQALARGLWQFHLHPFFWVFWILWGILDILGLVVFSEGARHVVEFFGEKLAMEVEMFALLEGFTIVC